MMAQLPKGWRYDRLKDVAALRTVKTDVKSADEDYLELEDIESWRMKILNRRNTLDVGSAVTLFRSGDVLFGKLRPYLAKVCRPDFNGKCTGEILAIHPTHVDGAYLKYTLIDPEIIERCTEFSYGAKMPRVNWATQLSTFEIPLPPRSEQERIAAFLDAKCADVDKAIAAKRRQLESIDGLWKNELAKSVTQGLNSTCMFVATDDVRIPRIPEGWRLEKIARCFDLIGSGTTPKSHMQDYYDGNIPWLQSGDLHGRYVDHTEKCVNETACRDCNLRIYRAPFIAVAMYGASIANLSIVRIDACTNQACCTLCLPRHLIDPDFAFFALSASRESLLQSAHGGTQPNISREVVRRLKIALPPKHEQAEIAKYLDKRRANLDALAANLRRQIETLEEYRKSLIHECVTGARSC